MESESGVMSADSLKLMLDELWPALLAKPKSPDLIIISKGTSEIMDLSLSLQGRNWRRVKREMRKLFKRQRLEMRLNPPKPSLDQTTSPFWRWRNQDLTEQPINAST